MIHKIIILTTAFMLTSGCATVKKNHTLNDAEIIKEVETAFNGLVEASMSLQLEPYLQYFDQEIFTSLNEDGTVYHSLKDFAKNYAIAIPNIAEYESLKFDNVKVSVIHPTVAILVNEFTAVVILNNGSRVTAKGAGTQVWRNRNGDWRLVHVSSSRNDNN